MAAPSVARMQRVIRAPLTWMIAAELLVVSLLILVAWHVFAGATTFHGPFPGLNLGVGFWRGRLGSLNRDEAAFEALEWRVTHAVMAAAHDYLETVVLPAVRRAERGGA